MKQDTWAIIIVTLAVAICTGVWTLVVVVAKFSSRFATLETTMKDAVEDIKSVNERVAQLERERWMSIRSRR